MLLNHSIAQLHTQLVQKQITAVDLVQEAYAQIEKYDGEIHSVITLVDRHDALAIAEKMTVSEGDSPLKGIPFLMKDAYATKGIRTTGASNVLNDFIPQYSATAYRKMVEAGAILIGKMNMDAWGHGGSTENTDFGVTHNPWDTTRVSGGSGGGPAAAIAARMASFAIGEDTGGSIRNPAAWNNISGLKVTYGRVSRYGGIAYASSFDTVGPTAKSVEDCALVLEYLAGQDPYDATTSPLPVPKYAETLSQSLRGRTLGIPKELFAEGLDGEIKDAIFTAVQEFEKLGIKTKELSMPLIHYALPAYYLIAPSETSSNLNRYDGIRYGNGRDQFTPETVRRVMIGTYALSSGYYDQYYRKAQKVRTLLIQEYEKALSECDAILMPVTPTPPTKIGELTSDPLQNLLADIYTISQNPVGVPSLALPCGFTKTGLPIGMQIVGKRNDEELLFAFGHQYQQVADWHTRKPPMIEKGGA